MDKITLANIKKLINFIRKNDLPLQSIRVGEVELTFASETDEIVALPPPAPFVPRMEHADPSAPTKVPKSYFDMLKIKDS